MIKILSFALIFALFQIVSPLHSASIFEQDTSPAKVFNLVWSPDGSKIAGVDNQGFLHLWDGIDGTHLKQFEVYDSQTQAVTEIAWGPDNTHIAVATLSDYQITIWDTATNELVQTLEGIPSPDPGLSIAWNPNGEVLAGVSHGESELLVLWYVTLDGFERYVTPIHTSLAYDLQWSHDGRTLAIPQFVRIHIIEVASDRELTEKRIDLKGITVAWSPDDTQLAVRYFINALPGEAEIRVGVINVDSLSLVSTMPQTEQFIDDLSWTLDGKRIVTQGEDNTYNVWEATTGNKIGSFTINDTFSPHFSNRSPFGGRTALFQDPEQKNSLDLKFIAVLPSPSVQDVELILEQCGNPDDLNPLATIDLRAFITQIEALPEDAVPAGCAADLVAVAEAILTQ